jgi:KipI family sensor histidine kinase inhibitor
MRARILPFGDAALLLAPEEPMPDPTPWCLAVAARARQALPGAQVTTGLASVLVALTPGDGMAAAARDRLSEALAGLHAPPAAPEPGRLHVLAARYDGPDLALVADLLGLSVEALVTRHVRATWVVAAVGFSPGFGYLRPDDAGFAGVPRRADPRPRVPAGAIALAAGLGAVYPSASPGGWQLLGSTEAVLFDAEAQPPARLAVGDLVRFQVQP